ncbi:MAG: DUF6062 family protein [Bacteroidetes bacterium]|nr:DUF6062 family protein [Bacteroidota bacterium]MCL5025666.1 DUF6062 family protein [Chloroflexota bacterium]
MDRDTTYFELYDALGQPGCPICWLESRAEQRYVQTLLREGVNDPDARERIRQTGGFCPEHARLLIDEGDALGSAIICQNLVRHLLDSLQVVQSSRKPRQSAMLMPQGICVACAAGDQSAGRYLRALLQCASSPEISSRLEGGDGLCLPHLRQAAQVCSDYRAMQALAATQSEVLRRLEEELAEFIRKKDYRFAHEPYGHEADSWMRALRMLAGSKPEGRERRPGKGA